MNEELLNDVKRVYKLLGHTPSVMEFKEHTQTTSWVTVCGRFGHSWTNVLRAAEIPIMTNHIVSKQEVIDAINIWFINNKNDIRCLEYWKIRKAGDRKEFPYSCNTIKVKFEGLLWEEIMKEIGYTDYETKDPYEKRCYSVGLDGCEYQSSIEKEAGDILYELKLNNKIFDYFYCKI